MRFPKKTYQFITHLIPQIPIIKMYSEDDEDSMSLQVNSNIQSSLRISHQNKKTLCFFCYNHHDQNELVQGICPNVYPQVQKQRELHQKQHYINCVVCEDGIIRRYVENVVYQESEDQYIQKVRLYDIQIREMWIKRALKENAQSDKQKDVSKIINNPNIDQKQFEKELQTELEFPRRKIKSTTINELNKECKTCNGQGKIYKIVLCQCQNGCHTCNQLKVKENPKYKQEKMKRKMQGKFVQKHEEKCIICFEELDMKQKSIQMQCKHLFHKKCITKWLQASNKCPICRNEDQDFTNYQQHPPREQLPPLQFFSNGRGLLHNRSRRMEMPAYEELFMPRQLPYEIDLD